MKLTDLIYAKTGISIDLHSLVSDRSAQSLIASLMVVIAKSDGGISPDEVARMVEMLREGFQLKSGEALDLVTRSVDEFAEQADLDELLLAVNEELALPHKEELMLMVLQVIAADDRKHAGEMKLLVALIEGLKIPENIMERVYERYFKAQKEQDQNGT